MYPTLKTSPHSVLFIRFWAIALLFHSVYTLEITDGLPLSWWVANGFITLIALLLSSPVFAVALLLPAWLVISPNRPVVFWLLNIATTVKFILQMPAASNHMIIELFMTLGISLAMVEAFIRQGKEARWHESYAALGRWLLVGMYFYGTFHKINTDFLNPVTSCAVTLWQNAPLPALLRDSVLLHYAAIYGTFVVEGVCILLLFQHRLRIYGIVMGILFHSFIAVNGYLNYTAFSLLCVALHLLFLSPRETLRVQALWRCYRRRLHPYRGVLIMGLLLLILAALGQPLTTGGTALMKGLYLGIAGVLITSIVAVYRKHYTAYPGCLYPRTAVAALLAVLFFINGFMPYLGGKTGQAIAMFSNLRTEMGENNHLWVPATWQVFAHQRRENIVHILEEHHLAYVADAAGNPDMGVVKTILIGQLLENPGAWVKVRGSDGAEYTLRADTLEERPGFWYHKYMSFRFVHFKRPVPCHVD